MSTVKTSSWKRNIEEECHCCPGRSSSRRIRNGDMNHEPTWRSTRKTADYLLVGISSRRSARAWNTRKRKLRSREPTSWILSIWTSTTVRPLINKVSVIQDESQPKIPKIYLEANDGARFRTMNHKTRFRQPAPTRTSFCYKKYYEDQQKEEQVPKVAVIMLDDEAAWYLEIKLNSKVSRISIIHCRCRSLAAVATSQPWKPVSGELTNICDQSAIVKLAYQTTNVL